MQMAERYSAWRQKARRNFARIAFQSGDSDKPWRSSLGVGVNIDQLPAARNGISLRPRLKEAGVELVSAKIILSRFIHHFIERYNQVGFKGLRANDP